ncbi:hypothetical protein HHI36_008853 [Cryptolaemus montrouzieri]|uniref:Uncharacterized protein n=1 Tax=Cryptolaemus montrouzieri TaxID=559131 RepID=A0ABD2MUC2_9CUCU
MSSSTSQHIIIQSKTSYGYILLSYFFSLLRKSSIVGCIYLLGYYHWSATLLIPPILCSFLIDTLMEHADDRRNIRKIITTKTDKELILSCYKELPPWVFFPDVERAEWLNRMIHQIWPTVNNYTRIYFEEYLEPELKRNFRAYLPGEFKFDRIHLGFIPPKITGMKTYDSTDKEQIIIDMNILYGGDCDFQFNVGGMSAGIKDFQLEGTLRFIMKPFIPTMPLVGGIQVFFINSPEVDFCMGGVTTLLEIPGIKEKFRTIIVSTIESMAVLPNKLIFQLSEDNDTTTFLRAPDPIGVLRIHIIEARNLISQDINGKSDPYVCVELGAQKFRTQTISKTLDPTWDYWCEFIINEINGQRLKIYVWDEDITNDDFLGNTSVDISSFQSRGHVNTWFTLEQVSHGRIHIEFFWYFLSKEREDLKRILNDNFLLNISCSSAIVTVFIDSAINLPVRKDLPNSYVEIKLGVSIKATQTCFNTNDPIWREGFCLLVRNPYHDILELRIIDTKAKQDIGKLDYHLKDLLVVKNLQLNKQPFKLTRSGDNSEIFLSIHLKIMKINDVAVSQQYLFG